MNEVSLSRSVDLAARQRAELIIEEITNSIKGSLQNRFRDKRAGNTFIKDDIINILKAYTTHLENINSDHIRKPHPTTTLLDACRAQIINDLLSGIPRLQERIDQLPEQTN